MYLRLKTKVLQAILVGAKVFAMIHFYFFRSELSGLSKYALFTKYNNTSVNRIPKNPTMSIGLWGRSYIGAVISLLLN